MTQYVIQFTSGKNIEPHLTNEQHMTLIKYMGHEDIFIDNLLFGSSWDSALREVNVIINTKYIEVISPK